MTKVDDFFYQVNVHNLSELTVQVIKYKNRGDAFETAEKLNSFLDLKYEVELYEYHYVNCFNDDGEFIDSLLVGKRGLNYD